MRIYVAASSKELGRAKWAMDAVRKLGHDITHDWVQCVEEEGEANPASASYTQRANWAEDDLCGVQEADVLWLLMPESEGFGAAVELGYALSKPYKRVVVSGCHERTIFTALANACYDNDGAALAQEFSL
jgi:hypothetical protein